MRDSGGMVGVTGGVGAADPPRVALKKAADTVVGSVFYGTLLRTLRSSRLQGSIGHGGRGEQVFQAQLDSILASEAGAARSFTLSESIVRRLGHQQEIVSRVNSIARGST